MKFAASMSRLGTETAFEVLARARELEAQGREIVHLQLGEPDFDTPAHVIQAGKKALDDGWTHYTNPSGIPQLRQAIADHVSATRGIKVDASEVVVEPGAKPIMFYSMLALLEAGDEILYPNPGFPIYESVAHYLEAKAIPLRFVEDGKAFRLDLNMLKDRLSDRTRMLVLNSPHNPTGSAISESDLKEIVSLVQNRDLVVLSDEIYGRILYDGTKGRVGSVASYPGMQEKTIILDGFSKAYAMTGWRLGYGVMPRALADVVARLGVNNHSCTSAATQIAGVAALNGPQDSVDKMIAEFHRRRDFIVKGLNEIKGFKCHPPQGAFYAFPNITGTGKSSREIAKFLLETAGVACLSGTAFGEFGEGYLRLSYANSMENIGKALKQIKAAV